MSIDVIIVSFYKNVIDMKGDVKYVFFKVFSVIIYLF